MTSATAAPAAGAGSAPATEPTSASRSLSMFADRPAPSVCSSEASCAAVVRLGAGQHRFGQQRRPRPASRHGRRLGPVLGAGRRTPGCAAAAPRPAPKRAARRAREARWAACAPARSEPSAAPAAATSGMTARAFAPSPRHPGCSTSRLRGCERTLAAAEDSCAAVTSASCCGQRVQQPRIAVQQLEDRHGQGAPEHVVHLAEKPGRQPGAHPVELAGVRAVGGEPVELLVDGRQASSRPW